jgi:hypothetical protein
MLRQILFSILIFLSSSTFGQKGFNVGVNNFGIGFGCSSKQNGVRLNLWDKTCGEINGLNLSLYSETKKVNGVSIGLLVSADSLVNGLNLGIIGSGSTKTNGISFGGLFTGGKKINGFGIAGLSVAADTLNGLFLSGYGNTYWNTDSIHLINGMSFGIIGGCFTKKLNGLSMGLIHNVTGVQNGLSISAFNRTKELHGVQIGLLNYAGNNRSLFRWLPLININLRKKASR